MVSGILIALVMFQGIFLGLKLSSAVLWSWWVICIPGFVFIAIIIFIAVVILLVLRDFK